MFEPRPWFQQAAPSQVQSVAGQQGELSHETPDFQQVTWAPGLDSPLENPGKTFLETALLSGIPHTTSFFLFSLTVVRPVSPLECSPAGSYPSPLLPTGLSPSESLAHLIPP